MRSLLLFLSRQRQLRKWMETSRAARPLSARFVAGETLEDALAVCRRMQREGIAATLDHLGESVTSLDEAAAARDVYLETLRAMSEAGLEANVSLKPTQFGMELDESRCRANVEALVREAAALGAFVRVDMESSEYTARTLEMVCDLHARYASVGAVIQSYLRRSRDDVEMLCGRGVRVRLCKGAYLEPAHVAFPAKEDVDRNFVDLTRILLERGVYPAIATHDEQMIRQTLAFVRERKVGRSAFEFQMLYGIRRDLQRELARDGWRVRVYVPFGAAWYPYFMRRLAERPANVLFLARNLLRR